MTDHSAGVGEELQSPQAPAAPVHGIQVDLRWAEPLCRGDGDEAQETGPPACPAADRGPVPGLAEIPAQQVLDLFARPVGKPERQLPRTRWRPTRPARQLGLTRPARPRPGLPARRGRGGGGALAAAAARAGAASRLRRARTPVPGCPPGAAGRTVSSPPQGSRPRGPHSDPQAAEVGALHRWVWPAQRRDRELRSTVPLGGHAPDPRPLEGHQVAPARAGQGPAGCALTEACGVGGVNDVLGVDPVAHPQRDAQVDVRLDVGADHARRPLGREDEVHAERPADGGDAHEPAEEGWQLLGQDAELVDDEDQPGNHGVGCVSGEGRLVLVEVLCPRSGEQRLAPAQLRRQGGRGPAA